MPTRAKKTKDLPQNSGFSAPMDFENMAEINLTAMNAAGAIGQRWSELISEINGEMIGFINTRLKEDITVPAELAKCQTGEDLFEFYSKFFKKAANQYFEEAEKLAHIGSDFVTQATKVVENEAQDVHKIAGE